MNRPAAQRGLIPLLCLVIAGLIAAAFLTNYIERVRPPVPYGYNDEDLALQGSRLKGFSFGAEGLLADWYWMRTLQYVGDKVLNSNVEVLNLDDLQPLNPRLVEPYLRNSTDLDPHFLGPYYFGAVVLPAIDKEKAIELTNKGIADNPNEWRLYQYLGYIYWQHGRYEEASEAYARGAKVPGAAPFLSLMAGAMKSQGGSRETARAIYRQMAEESDDVNIRNAALMRWQQLMALDDIDAIDRALSKEKQRRGTCVSSLKEILPHLRGETLPDGRDFQLNKQGELADPLGFPYKLTDNCTASLSDESPLPRK
jgi:tetratricopeptide (TPR) repeat protein